MEQEGKTADSLRVCYRCLIREMMDSTNYYERIGKYIDAISTDEKASKELYEERLNICRQCADLLEGTCNSCGCYVELRAASDKSYCPNKKW